MDTDNAQIMDKVRKLLALSQSPSESEAASALAKAQVLLAKYGLSITEVEEETEVKEEVLLEKQRLRAWESSLIYVVTRATFTEALHYREKKEGRIYLIGREINIVMARELFTYLHKIILILGRKHKAEVVHLASFKQGLVQRIGERLEDQSHKTQQKAQAETQQQTEKGCRDKALVLKMEAAAEIENKDFIHQKYGKTSTRRTGRKVDAQSYYRGKAVGDTINLNKQIGSFKNP